MPWSISQRPLSSDVRLWKLRAAETHRDTFQPTGPTWKPGHSQPQIISFCWSPCGKPIRSWGAQVPTTDLIPSVGPSAGFDSFDPLKVDQCLLSERIGILQPTTTWKILDINGSFNRPIVFAHLLAVKGEPLLLFNGPSKKKRNSILLIQRSWVSAK